MGVAGWGTAETLSGYEVLIFKSEYAIDAPIIADEIRMVITVRNCMLDETLVVVYGAETLFVCDSGDGDGQNLMMLQTSTYTVNFASNKALAVLGHKQGCCRSLVLL